ncbi:hypothetical protein GA0061101_12868 [Rhizobium lusitanum]|uniref:Uncharacterized protein n=1 Tax=Rhizobium lusitanum TaxID=293958 RepID=A0A1C3X8Y1_9HYPH|nr:hypothetical protein GA0061101_12868 [Rhizobium lusitanum]
MRASVAPCERLKFIVAVQIFQLMVNVVDRPTERLDLASQVLGQVPGDTGDIGRRQGRPAVDNLDLVSFKTGKVVLRPLDLEQQLAAVIQ